MLEHNQFMDYPVKNQQVVEDQDLENTNNRVCMSIHSASFKDFQLREELQNAIRTHGFEHPSEVQHQCIPQALNGRDIICQAKSGMGKTAVFVLSILHMIKPEKDKCQAVVITHTRELAIQAYDEFKRFAKDISSLIDYFLGGEPIDSQVKKIKTCHPNILVGAPGRLLQLLEAGYLKFDFVEYFVLDECDKMLQNTDMRAQVQGAFMRSPHNKQVMMFSATLPDDIRPVCRKLTKNPMEIYVDDQAKLTLHGLLQHYVNLPEEKLKNRKLFDLLDNIDFNQVIIFVKNKKRAEALAKILNNGQFPTAFIHGSMDQSDRIRRFKEFKDYGKRILVSTDLMGRGIDINKVNVVVNYDLPPLDRYRDIVSEKNIAYNRAVDQYLHRVGRAGRFGTKGLAITFVSSPEDATILNKVQERFSLDIQELPQNVDPSTYKDVARGEI
jgi:ATP-dependent RNA helicase UAP56/SUB2